MLVKTDGILHVFGLFSIWCLGVDICGSRWCGIKDLMRKTGLSFDSTFKFKQEKQNKTIHIDEGFTKYLVIYNNSTFSCKIEIRCDVDSNWVILVSLHFWIQNQCKEELRLRSTIIKEMMDNHVEKWQYLEKLVQTMLNFIQCKYCGKYLILTFLGQKSSYFRRFWTTWGQLPKTIISEMNDFWKWSTVDPKSYKTWRNNILKDCLNFVFN